MQTILREASISFPMLGDFSVNPSPSFRLFGHTFYWYGAVIALGFLLAAVYCLRHCRAYGIRQNDLEDYFLWLIPVSILGARLYFVLFHGFSDYLAHPLELFKVWNGGLAIYGGVIAGILLAAGFCKKRGIRLGALCDVASFGLLIGQSIGRWGNFLNREAFGGETDVFCRMGLTLPGQETLYVHPTFLYESLWNLTGFLLLHFWFKKHRRRFDGQIALLYFIWYGVGRGMIEGLRTDSLYIPGTALRVSQLLAIVSAAAALVLLLLLLRRREQPPLYADAQSTAAGSGAAQSPQTPSEKEESHDTDSN